MIAKLALYVHGVLVDSLNYDLTAVKRMDPERAAGYLQGLTYQLKEPHMYRLTGGEWFVCLEIESRVHEVEIPQEGKVIVLYPIPAKVK